MSNQQWAPGQKVKKFSVIQNKTIYGVIKKVSDIGITIKWDSRKKEEIYNSDDENILLNTLSPTPANGGKE